MSDESTDGTVTWRELMDETAGRLRRSGLVERPEVEARWIVEQATGTTSAELSGVLPERATVRGVAALDSMVDRRVGGEPIQYVLGNWPFRSLDLLVDGRALIPRPETELVAGAAIETIEDRAGPIVVDLGCGSGAIGLSVAAERPDAFVHLTDASADALQLARANLAGLGVRGGRVSVHHGDWFDALPSGLEGMVDCIVSNPPYVATADELPESVLRWEPSSALYAGADGLDDLQAIVAGSHDWLRPDGLLVLELDPRQVEAVSSAMANAGFAISVGADLAGHDRWLVGRLD